MEHDATSDRERIERLEAQVAALLADNERLRADNERLRADNEQLRARITELEDEHRGGKSAAPFARRRRKLKPKRPGRKPGEGGFTRKLMPEPNRPEEAAAPPAGCAQCGADAGALEHVRDEVVTVTTLPPPVPVVTPVRVPICVCRRCGRTTRGAHPAVAPDQTGATAHRFGADVHALAHTLQYAAGIPARKLPGVFAASTGIRITQSAITQHALKQAAPDRPVGKAVQRLREQLATAPVVHTDDTGWRTTHEPEPQAWLMAFESAGEPARDPAVTLFQIRPRHRSDEVLEVIPPDWPGTLVTDRGPSYDAAALAGVKQQKCLAHLARNIADVKAKQHPGARSFPRSLEHVLRQARELHAAWHTGSLTARAFRNRAGPLRTALSHLLVDRKLRDEGNQRLLNGLGWHDDRGSLLRFMADPWVEPTNNRAERALRPAVIARKVSQCSKTTRGADAHAAFMTVLATIKRRTLDAVGTLTRLLSGEPLPEPAR